ncbi:MFS transporter [Naasia lichenicola]|uniref:MFS transporter n=1 Tax=Naasia lichenicola TaxID=2565933 RepID=UPI00130E08EB|nr:MFS transporter [Naasia lichenicola]
MTAARGRETLPSFPYFALIVLAGAIFTLVTGEFLPTGLLPDMAADLGVSLSQTGILVTVFAVTVVVATTPLAALTRRVPRKRLVVIVMSANAVANVCAALAPTYELLVGARVFAGLCHGLFWAVVGAYAAHLVPRQQLARAVAVSGAGGTAAFVLGVPAGTAIGHAVGWRLAFVVIAIVVALLTLLVIRWLPPIERYVPSGEPGEEIRARRDPSLRGVLLTALLIVILLTGQNIFYTYIAPFSIETAGLPADAVPGLLLLYGVAGAVGLVLAGVFGGRYPFIAATSFMTVSAASVLLIWLLPTVVPVYVAVVVLWGVAIGALPALLQTRMMHVASPRIRDLAAAVQTTSFNFGIGIGALIGAVLISPIGLEGLPLVSAAVIAVGLVVLLVTRGSSTNR